MDEATFSAQAKEKFAAGAMTPLELYLYNRATKAEAENEKLWMELEKFLVVAPADDGAAPEPPASPEPSEPPPPPPPSGEDEAREAEERRDAENRRAQLNLQRQLAEQEALLSRQEEQDMYAYLKSTPTFGTVKDNFVLPGATAK